MAAALAQGAAAFTAVGRNSRPYLPNKQAAPASRPVVVSWSKTGYSSQIKRASARSSAVLATPSLAGATWPAPAPLDAFGIGDRTARVRCEAAAGSFARPGDLSGAAPLGDSTKAELQEVTYVVDSTGGSNGTGGFGKSGGGGGRGGSGGNEGDSAAGSGPTSGAGSGNLLALLSKGWQDRAAADPQFVFKVLTEQVIGVTACVLGDMASRPNFGLNELDFVFSTLVVGSIVNFALMYLLAPTTAAGVAAEALPSIFRHSPAGHMFEAGSYGLLERLGTFVYKGVQFATVGFFAGLGGTAVSNALLAVRKQLDPNFVLQNTPPPTFLNAATWALHMGFSSNFRYQCLNGLDQVLVKALSPGAFRGLAFVIRGSNNVIGGSTFVMLAKVTGSQKAASPASEASAAEAKGGAELQAAPASA